MGILTGLIGLLVVIAALIWATLILRRLGQLSRQIEDSNASLKNSIDHFHLLFAKMASRQLGRAGTLDAEVVCPNCKEEVYVEPEERNRGILVCSECGGLISTTDQHQ